MENPYATECLRQVCDYLCLDIYATHQLPPYDWFPVGFLVRHYLCTLTHDEYHQHLSWLLLRGGNPLEMLHTNPEGLQEDWDMCLTVLMDAEGTPEFHAHREALECLSSLLWLAGEAVSHNVDLWAPEMSIPKAPPHLRPMLKNAWHKNPGSWWLAPYSDQAKNP